MISLSPFVKRSAVALALVALAVSGGVAMANANCPIQKMKAACASKMGAKPATKCPFANAKGNMAEVLAMPIKQVGTFNTLLAAVKAAGMEEKFACPKGHSTLFAPTDAAFAKLPAGTLDMLLKPENQEKLRGILKFHVSPSVQVASKVLSRQHLSTYNGETLAVTRKDGAVYINNAKVLKTDVYATNGVIHVIDTVLMPAE
jgi:uncharacterized surface protein with fasciclin (FAS1) repeats